MNSRIVFFCDLPMVNARRHIGKRTYWSTHTSTQQRSISKSRLSTCTNANLSEFRGLFVPKENHMKESTPQHSPRKRVSRAPKKRLRHTRCVWANLQMDESAIYARSYACISKWENMSCPLWRTHYKFLISLRVYPRMECMCEHTPCPHTTPIHDHT